MQLTIVWKSSAKTTQNIWQRIIFQLIMKISYHNKKGCSTSPRAIEKASAAAAAAGDKSNHLI